MAQHGAKWACGSLTEALRGSPQVQRENSNLCVSDLCTTVQSTGSEKIRLHFGSGGLHQQKKSGVGRKICDVHS